MKISMVMVETINGKTTKGQTPGTSAWASSEDQEYFFSKIKENKLLIMGRKTYEAARQDMQITSERLRVILTSDPDKYQQDYVKDQLEFCAESPQTLITKLEERGYTKALLLGGEKTNTEFLQAGLVEEIWLTIEPKIFGRGNNLLAECDFEGDLQLIRSERLNEKGTLLLIYKVIR